jgi:hypothetical protein
VSHKLLTVLLLSACFLGMNASLWGQDAIPPHGIRGYLDPRTGIFHSIPHFDAPDAAEPLAKTIHTGSIVVNFTVTVSSAIASTVPIGCVADASVFDGATNAITEIAGTAVTRGTGTTVACSVTIPYSWGLASAPTDMIRVGYTVLSPAGFSTPAGQFPSREHSTLLTQIKVPASGTTTTLTVKARI